MRPICTVLLACIVLLLTGCDSGGDEVPLVRGSYSATFNYSTEAGDFSEEWTFSLQENGSGDLSGSGEMGITSVTVTGTHDHPDITLVFTKMTTGASQGSFTGTVSEDGLRLEGSYNFSIFFIEVPVEMVGAMNKRVGG